MIIYAQNDHMVDKPFAIPMWLVNDAPSLMLIAMAEALIRGGTATKWKLFKFLLNAGGALGVLSIVNTAGTGALSLAGDTLWQAPSGFKLYACFPAAVTIPSTSITLVDRVSNTGVLRTTTAALVSIPINRPCTDSTAIGASGALSIITSVLEIDE
jgi:hypothetical protein